MNASDGKSREPVGFVNRRSPVQIRAMAKELGTYATTPGTLDPRRNVTTVHHASMTVATLTVRR